MSFSSVFGVLLQNTGVKEQREKRPNETEYVPVPPTMTTVLKAYEEVDPDVATEEEKEAVQFFNSLVVTTLDTTLSSDAMIGRSMMEALDEKTDQLSRLRKKQHKKESNMEKSPNVWAMTMATAALFLDGDSGASDTKCIVHNLLLKPGEKAKKTKHFSKTKGIPRFQMYTRYYGRFLGVWLKKKRNEEEGRKIAANMAKWDVFTGLTRVGDLSAAQKRVREMPNDEFAALKKPRVDAAGAKSLNYGMFLDMIGDGNEMPPLGAFASDDSSGTGSEEARLQREQDMEVEENKLTAL
jgi:hypothetical protein